MTYSLQTTILGPSRGNAATILSIAKRQGSARLNDLKDYLDTVYDIAPKIGMRAEVVVAQSWHETAENNGKGQWVPWTSAWWKQRLNPAGLGITDDTKQNNASKTWTSGRDAAIAHMTHLWLYAKGEQLPPNGGLAIAADPRWAEAVRVGRAGIAPTIDGLTNTWGMDDRNDGDNKSYADKLLERLNALDPQLGSVTTPAPVVTLGSAITYLEQEPDTSIFFRRQNRNGTQTAFFRIGQTVRAIVDTARYGAAVFNAPVLGVEPKGSEATADWGWVEPDGTFWIYDQATNSRLRGADWVRADGGVIVVPEPDQGTGPTPPKPGETITARNYKLVADPTVLLPPDLIWRGTTNFFPDRQGYGPPVAFVHHCTDDLYFPNTDSWFQQNGSNASAHFVIDREEGRDGFAKVYQYVSSKDAAWTNGDWDDPRSDVPWLNDALQRGINTNCPTIAAEYVATPSTPPTAAQYKSGIALARYFAHPKVYGIGVNRGTQNRHADVNSVSREYCPGPDFDLAYIITELGGDPTKMAT